MDHKIWDGMAIDYDNSVENNQDPIIVNYLKKEIDILTNLCKKVYDQNKNSSIIDMGAGTGRVIFCLLYTSPSPRDKRQSRMPSSA